MSYAKIKALAGATVLLTTLGFGLYPFNFFSRNDVAFEPDIPAVGFHTNADKRNYSQQAIAYTEGPILFPANRPLTIVIEAIPSKIPNGLGTIVEIHDELDQPPLMIAQWRNHLAIRSRRLNTPTGRAYQEIGLSNCLQLGSLVSLMINYDGFGTRIFTDGKLAATKSGYHLLDRHFPLSAHITIGNNATGERGWIGALKRIAVYDESISPHESGETNHSPIIEYVFDKPFANTIPNRIGHEHSLHVPTRFRPLESKRFAPLSSFLEREDWQSSDVTVNFFGFIPSSIVIFLLLWRRSRPHWLLPIYTTAGAFALSLIIECSQIILPSRSPSYVDLCVNTLAGLLTSIALILFTWKGKRHSTRLTLPTD